MASKIYQDYAGKYPNGSKDAANAEFVVKKLDEAMDGHDHDGSNSPIINTSVTLDFNVVGGRLVRQGRSGRRRRLSLRIEKEFERRQFDGGRRILEEGMLNGRER